MMNTDSEGCCRSIRSVYGKCGVNCVFISTGYGVTGVCEIYETE